MSNVMSLKQIKNKPNRSAFDLSQRKLFTAKVGELLPVFCKPVLPGDKFNLNVSAFTRTQPVNSAAFTRIKEYYDWFFVPYRLLWRYFPQFITDTQASNPQFAVSPTTSSNSEANRTPYFDSSDVEDYLNLLSSEGSKNEFGFSRHSLSYKLLKMLGYGIFTANNINTPGVIYSAPSNPAVNVNAFPLLAYQKICQDYFRNTQWENAAPYRYNVDYLRTSSTKVPISVLTSGSSLKQANFFDLNYCTWNKDLFTGLLPSPQYGDTASISNGALKPSLSGNLSINPTHVVFEDSSLANASFEAQSFRTSSTYPQAVGNNVSMRAQGDLYNASFLNTPSTIVLDSSDISGFNVLALRQAEALQKWREISLSGKQDYKDQIEKHFGVHVPDVLSNLCSWIGGSTSILDIGEVVNTNLQGINDKNSTVGADIAGKGVGSFNARDSFSASEHGILMCIYHACPLMDYSDDVSDPFIFSGSKYDYPIPEFDRVGMQSVPSIVLGSDFSKNGAIPDTNSSSLSTDYFNSLGYAPRYYDYKTSVDVVTGAFTNSLAYWAAPLTSAYVNKFSVGDIKKLSSSFFKVNPSILNTIFGVAADGTYLSDNLLITAYADIKAVRNLDYDGLPY